MALAIIDDLGAIVIVAVFYWRNDQLDIPCVEQCILPDVARCREVEKASCVPAGNSFAGVMVCDFQNGSRSKHCGGIGFLALPLKSIPRLNVKFTSLLIFDPATFCAC